MSNIKTPVVDLLKLAEWDKIRAKLEELKVKEMSLRKEIFDAAFPNPVEGTNKIPIDSEYQLTAQYKINRKLDEAAVLTMGQSLLDQGVPMDRLVEYKPNLKMAVYNELRDNPNTAHQFQLFAQLVTETPGSPTMSVTRPKGGAKRT